MRIPVYLASRTFRDQSGTLITIRERRLIRQNAEDRIIAVIEAPSGTRVRSRRDQFGLEHLVVPLESTFWGRHFGPTVIIPAKYVIGKARYGESGLSLVHSTTSEVLETKAPSTPDDVCAAT